MRLICLAPLAFVIGLQPATAQVMNDEMNRKVLSAQSETLLLNKDYFNELLKQRQVPMTDAELLQLYEGKKNCGSVSIGNQTVSQTGNSDINIIITGDVINVGNRCGG